MMTWQVTTIEPGAWCAGNMGWDENRTISHCLSRATSWLPDLEAHLAYPCYAKKESKDKVFIGPHGMYSSITTSRSQALGHPPVEVR